MTGGYSDRPDRQEMLALIRAAVDRGVTFFDTAEIYGPDANEELVGEALAPHQGRAQQQGPEEPTANCQLRTVALMACMVSTSARSPTIASPRVTDTW